MGRTQAGPLAVIIMAALVVSGCTSNRVGGLNTQPSPLTPAPSGTVTSNQLPPPTQPGVGSPAIGPDGFPIAPGQTGVASADPNADTTDPDAVDGADTDSSVVEVASAQPVSREEMVGAWRVSTQGADCQMFMALTRWSTGFRAASRGCPGDAANVSSWNINGNRVVLSDSGGNQVATLFSSGSGRFDGQTSGGQAISLAR
ncbi:hypothetical protein E0E05_00260 [Roseitalea porphyridii]|uniref:Alkaline proteinase inhibitor/ Outer membrane lipoprotein Omp19 domain-containing protein n=1 Tax=Roseitalea porphyridii TaxID=1852022 RepID=A0A4P6UXR6_9HYPH|nr:hypothetical protein E0E05_00260 [Roseitalea porphyridii]